MNAIQKSGQDRKILIVGASGRLGRMIQAGLDQIAPAGMAVRLLTRRNGAVPAPGDRFCQWLYWTGDLTDPAVFEWPDVVVNLIGLTPTSGCEAATPEALYTANVMSALQIISQSRQASRILIASSASVYGSPDGSNQLMFSEIDALSPITDYARSKAMMERRVAALADPRVTVMRIGNVAGADQLVQNALKSGPDTPLLLDRFASGFGPMRSYIGPLGLARAVLGLIDCRQPLPNTLNIACPEPIRMETLLTELIAAGLAISWAFREARPGAIESVYLDTRRLESFHKLNDRRPTAKMIAQETADYLRQTNEKSSQPVYHSGALD